MFKNINIFSLNLGALASLHAMEDSVQKLKFAPCSPTQDLSYGFVAPRDEDHGALVESVGGQRVLKFLIETKSVPKSAIDKRAAEVAEKIEQERGRKPGKKEMREIKEDVRQALLPSAFPKQTTVTVWIDPERQLMITDASTLGKNDHLISSLVEVGNGFVARPFHTVKPPQTAMTEWLLAESEDDLPADLFVSRECELKSQDEEKSSIRFARHHLFNESIRKHVQEGKFPVSLGMNWAGRIDFTLTSGFQLRKVRYLDGVVANSKPQDNEDPFDANVSLTTGELRLMLPCLISALGGELVEKETTSGEV